MEKGLFRGITMSIKGRIAEIIFLGVVKWIIVLIFAGVIAYFIIPKYEIVEGKRLFNKITGRIEKREIKF
ncbi:hypothetical protein COB11_01385 [Candidatus Aerophobetes bacterium]|uniref:Uncharacterized protein n=1 Tax=Aerophobetes bacterium TaxID=2030807 RepID=A0A2A4YLM7_UNCAE|nr:MAG: hypothetical protein COB11_01385 [Candidatus Aerophobetes bacterium]